MPSCAFSYTACTFPYTFLDTKITLKRLPHDPPPPLRSPPIQHTKQRSVLPSRPKTGPQQACFLPWKPGVGVASRRRDGQGEKACARDRQLRQSAAGATSTRMVRGLGRCGDLRGRACVMTFGEGGTGRGRGLLGGGRGSSEVGGVRGGRGCLAVGEGGGSRGGRGG